MCVGCALESRVRSHLVATAADLASPNARSFLLDTLDLRRRRGMAGFSSPPLSWHFHRERYLRIRLAQAHHPRR